MQTKFTPSQLAEPGIREANRILRSCVHCGFCTATCPTYQLLGDELDSPRGRIYLIKEMLEHDRQPTDNVVKHIDRCLSCLSCMTTCPSGVNYMHLIDQARAYIERRYRRPVMERLLRWGLATLMPRPSLFKIAMQLSSLSQSLHRFLPQRLKTMTALSHQLSGRGKSLKPLPAVAVTNSKGKVGLLLGCVQQAVDDRINHATMRLLDRLGYEVICFTDSPCCGAIEHHLGKEAAAMRRVKDNVTKWSELITQHQLEGIIINASGCGTMIKDYGHLLQDDADLKAAAAHISHKALDITEFLIQCDLSGLTLRGDMARTVAYLNPCSMQHGQRITQQPVTLLEQFGFRVEPIPEGHMCCGSAGTYNLLQPELAGQLGQRKAANIRAVSADMVATGNLGCMLQMRQYLDLPLLHTVELLDWASGGNRPDI